MEFNMLMFMHFKQYQESSVVTVCQRPDIGSF